MQSARARPPARIRAATVYLPMAMGMGAPLKAMNTDAEGRLHHHVRADTLGAFGGFRSRPLVRPTTRMTSVTSTATADHGDEGAQRPVQDILYDHVTDHRFLWRLRNFKSAKGAAPCCSGPNLCKRHRRRFRRH